MRKPMYFDIFSDGSVQIEQETTVFEFDSVADVRGFISACEAFVKQCEESSRGNPWPNKRIKLPKGKE